MDTRYLFIDGGCLRATLRNVAERYFGGQEISIDYNRLKSDHRKAFYYDAIPAMKHNETDEGYAERIRPRIELHNRIATLPGYHIYEGDSRIRRKQVQQKEVDVMIAVDMLTHTFRGNMDRATFVASDIDFKPLLDALVREGMFVNLLYPPADTNQDLVNAADQRTPLAINYLHQFLDRESQERLVLPSTYTADKRGFNHRNSSVVEQHENYGEVRYQQLATDHSFYWDSPHNIDHLIQVRSSNYDVLRNFLEDLYLIKVPEQPPHEALV